MDNLCASFPRVTQRVALHDGHNSPRRYCPPRSCKCTGAATRDPSAGVGWGLPGPRRAAPGWKPVFIAARGAPGRSVAPDGRQLAARIRLDISLQSVDLSFRKT